MKNNKDNKKAKADGNDSAGGNKKKHREPGQSRLALRRPVARGHRRINNTAPSSAPISLSPREERSRTWRMRPSGRDDATIKMTKNKSSNR